MGKPGLTSFQLTGHTVKLKPDVLWVSPEDNNGGYNLLYTCNAYHGKCQLMLQKTKNIVPWEPVGTEYSVL